MGIYKLISSSSLGEGVSGGFSVGCGSVGAGAGSGAGASGCFAVQPEIAAKINSKASVKSKHLYKNPLFKQITPYLSHSFIIYFFIYINTLQVHEKRISAILKT
jgi:hypothetical protein